ECHGPVRDYSYHLLDLEVRRRYHRRAADLYIKLESFVAAAHHLSRSDANDLALDLLTSHAPEIVVAGGAGALLESLSRFDVQRLPHARRVALRRARADGHKMRAEYQKAIDDLTSLRREVETPGEEADILAEIGK